MTNLKQTVPFGYELGWNDPNSLEKKLDGSSKRVLAGNEGTNAVTPKKNFYQFPFNFFCEGHGLSNCTLAEYTDPSFLMRRMFQTKWQHS